MREEEKTAMLAFYSDADRDIAALKHRLGVVCSACGNCCRFDEVDHILYASDLEKRHLVHASTPAMGQNQKLMARGLRCPFQVGDTCTARTGRVLGCRLHHCDPLWSGEAGELSERLHQKLKKMHDELGVEWRYAPLFPL